MAHGHHGYAGADSGLFLGVTVGGTDPIAPELKPLKPRGQRLCRAGGRVGRL